MILSVGTNLPQYSLIFRFLHQQLCIALWLYSRPKKLAVAVLLWLRGQADLEPGDMIRSLDAPDEEKAGKMWQAASPQARVSDEVKHRRHGSDPDSASNDPAAKFFILNGPLTSTEKRATGV